MEIYRETFGNVQKLYRKSMAAVYKWKRLRFKDTLCSNLVHILKKKMMIALDLAYKTASCLLVELSRCS